MVVYKKILKYQGVTYFFTQDRWNSTNSHILNDDEEIVARINNKTSHIQFISELPEVVKEKIKSYIDWL